MTIIPMPYVAIWLLVFLWPVPLWGSEQQPGLTLDSKEAQEKAEAAVSASSPEELGVTLAPAEAIPILSAQTGLKSDGLGVQEAISALKAKKTPFAIRVNLKSDVLFDFDKADIKSEAASTLSKVALIIEKKGKGQVLIEGHTDSKGTNEYNQRLSEKRAFAVKRWLVEKHGIAASRIEAKGWGETKPVAPNTNPDGSDNPAGRAMNRRVVITISTVKTR